MIEQQAERVVKSTTLPAYFSVGAKKAYKRFQDFYGSTEGRRIFAQKAIEQGRGSTFAERANSVFKTGARLKGGKAT